MVQREAVLVAVGQRLRDRREAKGLSQEALADLAELHRTFVGSVERGERNVSVVNIYRLAQALGSSASDLLPSVE
jgi:transcriptional regulator with XRE-family HTH domain